MRTDQLIDSLAANLQPVDRSRVSRRLCIALAIGLAASIGEILLFIGPYQGLDGRGLVGLFSQLPLTFGIVVITAIFLFRSTHPGVEVRGVPALASFPVGAIVAFAAVGLMLTHRFDSVGMTVDNSSLACLLYIPLFAIVPFTAVAWALRTGAPTHLVRAGAAAGLISGALSASACALPCANNQYVAVALCHGLALEICAGLGAIVGPRILRW